MPLKFQIDELNLTPVRVRITKAKSRTETDGLSKTTFLDVLKVVRTSQIRSNLEVNFMHDANTSMGHRSKIKAYRNSECNTSLTFSREKLGKS